MPVSINWKEFYHLEYQQLKREGYVFSNIFKPEEISETLPIARINTVNSSITKEENEHWENAYYNLIKEKKETSTVSNYNEPNDLNTILSLTTNSPKMSPATDYENRVKGAWYARCAGVVAGKPLEMGLDRKKVEDYLRSVNDYPLSDYVPAYSKILDITLRTDCIPSSKGNVKYVQSDDDIHYTICSLLLFEQYGENFTKRQAADNLLDNITYHWVWTADRALYENLIHLNHHENIEEQLEYIGEKMNPWRESMCPQLKADFWGYITPGNPRKGAALIHRLGSLSATQNGLYGGMFMQGCVSAAMSENPTIACILDAGLSNIPQTSRLYEAIVNVRKWYNESKEDWIYVCDKIYECYGDWYFAGAINNLCFVTLSLLHGNLDFEKTISTAIMCGTDTDCNSGNAASVVGAAIGYEKLPQKWIAPLNNDVRSAVAGFGFGSIDDLVNRTIKCKELML